MVDTRFIVRLNGKEFVKYEGLLNAAHEMGLKSIRVEIIQLPNDSNNMTAICRANVENDASGVYVDYGDASPQSVNSKIVPHIIRMASTRAKARALRDFTNIGMTAIEELNPNDVEVSEPPTIPQLNLLKKLSKELNLRIDFNELDKKSASEMIEEFSKAKREYQQKKAT
ncbi:hypothetical protein SAMN05660462_02472 [Proteiniborus ethanoligenes]|uniref:Uncharacterized protein n=1 Tax=Proteiniborus ethanoligenes TaxID=415015 RepID=A0A1H3RQH3_9FIRM|nr:hypothetical protein [Proteiniborus ethanoligenes]SDZ27139.1 hypothetical protein SAMN05660462_02472 [Proteiniborus ethanoligenes]